MIILIGVLLYAIWRGWRTGFVHQLAGVLGIGFGIVAARIFCSPVSEWLLNASPSLGEGFAGEYKVKMLSGAIVFAIAYTLIYALAALLRSAMSLLRVGALNSIAGAAFSLLKWVMIMSVIYNVILSVFPRSDLGAYCDDGDGNIVELVMCAAPAVMGIPGPDELDHRRRMEEAKAISNNTDNLRPKCLTEYA